VRCRVCGREFSPSEFQVVVPGLGQGFDRVECALEASAMGLPAVSAPPAPPPVVVPAPPPVVVPAGLAAGAAAGAPAALAALSAEPARAPLLLGTNLALLGAGTAATIYLWLRVFGADATSVILPADSAAPPFERSTVAASIDLTPAATRTPAPESSVRGGDGQPAAQPVTPAPAPAAPAPAAGGGNGGPVLVVNPPPATPKPPASPPTVGPSPLPPRPAPPEEPEPPRSPPAPGEPGKPDDRGPGGGNGGGHGQPKPSKPDKPDKPDPGKGRGHEKDHEIPHGKGNGEKKGHGKHH
jgi:hypothetical protein